jgi:SWI/SNF-related matrix-associated actin-dependent regulator of chromatin subfamily A3
MGSIDVSEVYNINDGCPICLSDFKDPIALHCKHVFCKDCAGGLPPIFEKCPICRSTNKRFYASITNKDENSPTPETTMTTAIETRVISLKRFEFLENILASSESSIVIYCSIQTNIPMIESYLQAKNISCTKITGNMTLKQRETNINRFSNKECRVILFTPRIAAAGINLTVANKLIFWDYCWTHDTMKQAIGRLVRLGQASPDVDIYFLEHEHSLESIGNDFLFKCERKEKGTQLDSDDPYDRLCSCVDPLDYIEHFLKE